MNKQVLQAEQDQMRGQVARMQRECKQLESEAEAASVALRMACYPAPTTSYADLDRDSIKNHSRKLVLTIGEIQKYRNAIDELKIKLGDED